MIIWSGWGILLLPIVALCCGIIFTTWYDLFDLKDSHPFISNLAFLISFVLASPIAWYVGKFFNRPSKDQVFIHKETGEEYKYRPAHSFFFIRMEYWAYILPVIGIIGYLGLSLGA